MIFTNPDEAWFLCENGKILLHMPFSMPSANALRSLFFFFSSRSPGHFFLLHLIFINFLSLFKYAFEGFPLQSLWSEIALCCIFYFLFLLILLFIFVAWVPQDWSEIAELIFYFYFFCLVDLGLWHRFLTKFCWVPLLVGLGMWTAPLLGFLCKSCRLFKGFCRREGDMKKREFMATSTFLEKRGRWEEEERGREKMVFFFFLAWSLSFLSKPMRLCQRSRFKKKNTYSYQKTQLYIFSFEKLLLKYSTKHIFFIMSTLNMHFHNTF